MHYYPESIHYRAGAFISQTHREELVYFCRNHCSHEKVAFQLSSNVPVPANRNVWKPYKKQRLEGQGSNKQQSTSLTPNSHQRQLQVIAKAKLSIYEQDNFQTTDAALATKYSKTYNRKETNS